MKRILVFSPYYLWKDRTLYDLTIAAACQVRGANVEYVLCDGMLPECDQHWDSKWKFPRPFDLCQRCTSAAKANMNQSAFAYRWLGDFVNPVEKSSAFEWAQSVPVSGILQASFKEAPLGEWVKSSVISYFRHYPPDLANWHVTSVYRGFLYGAAIAMIGLRNYLDANPVDSGLLFNGRQSVTRVALEVLRQKGVRLLTHERAEYQRGYLTIRPNAHCMNVEPFREFWKMWSQIPLNRVQLDSAFKWLVQRRYGANLAWLPFNASFDNSPDLRTQLDLSRNKRLWVLFTSSTDEIAGDPLWQGPYASQIDWVRNVVSWVERRDDVQLVIKVHPNLGGNEYIGEAENELQFYLKLKSALPPNVRIVLPKDAVNAYSLADAADLGLTFGSTIGLEMAMLGKPVLLASRALYDCGSQIFVIRSRESSIEALQNCLHASTDREIQREAFRIAHYYFFASELPFPAVAMHGIFDTRVNYRSREDLKPGKDPSMDRICDFLIDGRPYFDEPNEQERCRSRADEDAFFEILARKPHALRNARYERWQRWRSFGRSSTQLVRKLPFGESVLELGRGRWHSFLGKMEK